MNDSVSSGPVMAPPKPKTGTEGEVERVQRRFAEIYSRSKEIQSEKPSPPGWWSVKGIEGSLSRVLEAIEASAIPEDAKAFLKSRATAKCIGTLNFVAVHAHCHTEGSREILSCDIQASKKLI